MTKTDRLNILFIMADQYRYDYLGSAGASFVRTPNLDRLAEQGTRFAQCTTNCPVCVPARIGLATGWQPFHAGILNNGFGFSPYGIPMYYQRLRDYGYRVSCVGKLHLGGFGPLGRNGDRPCAFQQGFTHPLECEGKIAAGGSPTPFGPYTHYLRELGLLDAFHRDYQERRAQAWSRQAWSLPARDSVLPTEAFEDVFIGRKAAEWLRDVPDDYPWHCFVSFVGPHDPFDPPTEYADRFRQAEVPQPISASMDGKPDWVRQRVLSVDPPEVAVSRRQYCGSIETIDDQVGLILETLERRDMLDSTIIVFTSDHGEMLGDHGLYSKFVAYEPSLRVPLIVAGPGIRGGQVSDALVELIDINPTLCELVGLPPQERLDAISFVPVLQGASTEHRTEAVSAITNFRLVRTGRYKLIENYNEISELYDLENDPQELKNIADEEPELVRELGRRLRARYHGAR